MWPEEQDPFRFAVFRTGLVSGTIPIEEFSQLQWLQLHA
jgi:hypothetical protein